MLPAVFWSGTTLSLSRSHSIQLALPLCSLFAEAATFLVAPFDFMALFFGSMLTQPWQGRCCRFLYACVCVCVSVRVHACALLSAWAWPMWYVANGSAYVIIGIPPPALSTRQQLRNSCCSSLAALRSLLSLCSFFLPDPLAVIAAQMTAPGVFDYWINMAA